jgi:hypothetical protein
MHSGSGWRRASGQLTTSQGSPRTTCVTPCASLMRAAGADVKAIQQQLGHRSATVTLNTYTHLFEGDFVEAVDRLDAHLASETRSERVLGGVVDLVRRGRTPRLTRGLAGSGGRLELPTNGLAGGD